MRIIDQSHEIKLIAPFEAQLDLIEGCGRVAYASEDSIAEGSAKQFVKMIVGKNHGAVLEHSMMTVMFTTDRGVSHELVRHRLASFTQESTRYVSSHERPLKVKLTDENIIDLYTNHGISMLKISKMLRPAVTEDYVYYHLKKAGIALRNRHSKGIRDEMFFHAVDTSQKAYLLGFIQADGSLGNKSHQISIIQKNGWFIERLLADFMGVRTRGYLDQNCRVYSFSGEQWHKDLVAKGIIPNKTYDQTDTHIDLLWNSIPLDYKWDFLRGFLDGDGTIRFFEQQNEAHTKSFSCSWVGHPKLLEYIAEFLKAEIGGTCNIYPRKDALSNLHALTITGYSRGIDLCTKMYSNFQFPYGKPEKTSRVFEAMPDLPFAIASWGSSKFQVIRPDWFTVPTVASWIWAESMSRAEEAYKELIELGQTPQQARSVLPNSLKTKIAVTANFREWLHIFQLRAVEKDAHPQMRDLMIPLYEKCRSMCPEIFDLGDPE
jgi:thymidylate synthase ThyX